MSSKFVNKILYYVAAIAFVVMVLCIVIAIVDKDSVPEEIISFQLKGSETMSLYVGERYKEPGYLAKGDVSGDLNQYVKVEGKVNTNSEGTYDVDYQLEYNGVILYKTRVVNVLRKPVVDPNNAVSGNVSSNNNGTSGSGNATNGDDSLKIKLKGYTKIYMLNGVNYKEEGATVYQGGKEVSIPYTTSGNVDNNTPGVYKITYTATNDGKSVSVDRTIEVLNMRMYSTVSEKVSTNKSVVLKLRTETDKFKYMVLPDGTKVENTNHEYVVTKNGSYTVEVVNEHGLKRKYVYNINNIDKTAPVGSCSGYTTHKKSFITMNATDNVGISKYVVDGVEYKQNVIEVNKVISQPSITIYDMVGNTKTVTCTLENRYTYISSDSSIQMKYKLVTDKDRLSYGMYYPSMDNGNEKIPLLVYLHGSGTVGGSDSKLQNTGVMGLLKDWKFDGVNCYVIAPHLKSGSWQNTKSFNAVNLIVDDMIKNYNVDPNRIIISGGSLGGQGSIYHAVNGVNRYAALVSISPYNTPADLNVLNKIPLKIYSGHPSYGEDSNSYNFTMGKLKNAIGTKDIIVKNTSHGGIVKVAFHEDTNNDNKSDLFEWILSQEK